MRPQPSLSVKNLERVFAWVEANEDHPLAILYYNACIGVPDRGEADDALDALRPLRGRGVAMKHIDLYYGWRDHAIDLRDSIGRAILTLMKKGEL